MRPLASLSIWLKPAWLAGASQSTHWFKPVWMRTPLRHSNFYRRAWLPAVASAGLPGIHFHDLRHAGNTLTAGAGASLRELMDRMGH
jgi:integrase